MAYSIIETCVSCHACLQICPSEAIYQAENHFMVDAKKCTDCEGDYADPQCSSICPVEGAILDGFMQITNPPGSLTGIPPARLQLVRAEIQAR